MNPRQLEAFLATVRQGSITGAARQLGIAQPSASRLIADLERSLDFRLFVRSGRGLIPTPEARRFHRAVESMYTGMDRLRQTAQAIRLSGEDVLSVGMIAIFTHSNLIAAVRELYQSRPALRISLSVRTNQDIIHSVRLQQMDLGVVSTLHAIDELHIVGQAIIPYVCVIPKSHDEAKECTPLDLRKVRAERFVALPNEYIGGGDSEARLLDDLHQRARLQSHSLPMVASLASTTQAFALVDPFSARVALALGGVVSRPITQALYLPVAIVCHAPDTLTEAGRDMAERLRNYLQSAGA